MRVVIPFARSARALAVAAIASGLPALGTAQAPTRAAQPTAPTFAGVWFGGPLDSIYNAEYERLAATCRGKGDACYAAELDTTAVRLAPVWSEPGAAQPAGWLVARLRARGAWPYAALLFQGAGGGEIELRDDLGDWGYGTTLALRAAREGWVQPWLLEAAGSGWLDASGMSAGFGVVDGPYGLAGRLWRTGAMEARPVGGAAGAAAGLVELGAGVYMVLEVLGDTVRLRAETPMDMDCGDVDEAAAAGEEPPVYEVGIEQLTDPSGRPRVEVAYGKGC